ncbi:MAG: hypothetical protein D6719_13945 [Candidatus Dadabacteria bacterium]|nr:MAG: hypothetical protein D6719_13945 [Candidatus Dadabacteria bacterium]
MNWLNKFLIVLVRPCFSKNVGSIARAMSNFGFSNLRIVAGDNLNIKEACVTACHGSFILDNIECYSSLDDAIADVELVIGFSARVGRQRMQPVELKKWSKNFWSQYYSSFPTTALVFGPEDNGLSWKDTTYCSQLVNIETPGPNRSLNLAQAVLLVLYELSSNRQKDEQYDSLKTRYATQQSFSQLDLLVEQVLTLSRFYGKGTPRQIPGIVRNLFRRIRPTAREMQILLGIFSRIEKQLKFNDCRHFRQTADK